jgi:hypothetical protein
LQEKRTDNLMEDQFELITSGRISSSPSKDPVKSVA